MPTEARTARHSRLTAACMSSVPCGKYRARRHCETFSNTAPWAVAQGSITDLRTGWNSAPLWWPERVPKVVGV